jgi:HK97 family phage major capsid protein
LSAEGKGICNTAQAEERELSAVEHKRLDAIEGRLKTNAIELAGVEVERERERNAPSAGEATPTGAGRSYRALFGAPAPSAQGWASNTEYFAAVASGRFDPRLIPATSDGVRRINAAATEGVGTAGGFLVPDPLFAAMLDASLESEVVRSRCEVWPMTSNTRKVVGVDASDGTAGLYAGVSAQCVPEGGEFAEQTPKLRMIELSVCKVGLLTQVSNELLADALNYGQTLETLFVGAMGKKLDSLFLTGSGAGEPKGILNDAALITVPKVGGQTAATILYENLCSMLARLHPASVQNAIWICSQSTRAELLQLAQSVGLGGVPYPVLRGTAGKFEMLTLPCVFTEKLPALGTKGDIILADLSQYVIGLRQDMSLDRSTHVGFTRDTTYFRGIIRADGQGKWGSPYTPEHGATLSWCVALADRK